MTRVPACVGVVARLALATLLALAFASPSPADESALTVADLAAYRAALSWQETKDGDDAPVAVGFRELWDHPATYQGRRVQVRGRIVRRFRQGPFGTFPPLEEAWAVSRADNPFCLVFPADPGAAKVSGQATRVEGEVKFVGTFLKLIRYQGGDGPRLAPLIVGPAAPAAVAVAVASDRESSPAIVPGFRPTPLDWTIGLAAASLVVLVLAGQHLRRPSRRPLNVTMAPPAPLFDDEVR